MPLIVYLVVIVFVLLQKFVFSSKGEYVLTKIEKKREGLKEYEKQYLNALFSSGNEFSTFKEKNNIDKSRAREIYKKIEKVKEVLYEEMNVQTKAFEISPKWRGWLSSLGVIWMIFIFGNTFLLSFAGGFNQKYFLIISVIISVIIIYLSLTNPRLNKKVEHLRQNGLVLNYI